MQQLQALNEDELAFIERRYRTESKIYLGAMNVMLVLAAVIPLGLCIVLIFLNGEADVNMNNLYRVYFAGLAFMVFLVGLIAFGSYRIKLWNYSKDKAQKQKVVELTNIVQKKYMKLNNTYHFYLNSKVQCTVEVSKKDFDNWQLGDEINVEYAQFSKEYFGYY